MERELSELRDYLEKTYRSVHLKDKDMSQGTCTWLQPVSQDGLISHSIPGAVDGHKPIKMNDLVIRPHPEIKGFVQADRSVPWSLGAC